MGTQSCRWNPRGQSHARAMWTSCMHRGASQACRHRQDMHSLASHFHVWMCSLTRFSVIEENVRWFGKYTRSAGRVAPGSFPAGPQNTPTVDACTLVHGGPVERMTLLWKIMLGIAGRGSETEASELSSGMAHWCQLVFASLSNQLFMHQLISYASKSRCRNMRFHVTNSVTSRGVDNAKTGR
jgi:hypothetical protein